MKHIFVLSLVTIILALGGTALGQTIYFFDDAEQAVAMANGIGGGWTLNTGSPASSQAQVHSGIYSYVLPTGATAYQSYGTGPDPTYLKLWFYLPSNFGLGSGSSQRIAGLVDTSLTTYPFYVTNSGGTLYLNAASTNGTHAISTNAWHSVEFEYYVGGGQITVWLDGTQDINVTGLSLVAKTQVMVANYGNTTGAIYEDDITVSSAYSGNPTSWMAIRNPYLTNRTAAFINVYLWGAASTDKLVTSVDSTTVSTVTNPGTYQQVLLTLTGYSAGSHTLTVQLQNSGGTARQTVTESFNAFGGTPLVAIDQYNHLIANGNKIFPIMPWDMNPGEMLYFFGLESGTGNLSPPGINAACCVQGYQTTYSESTYYTELTGSIASGNLACTSTGIQMIGPGNNRGGDVGDVSPYVTDLDSNSCILGWFGYDEAEYNDISASTLNSFMTTVHGIGNNHPVLYDDSTYPYLNLQYYAQPSANPGLPYAADIYSSDDYPLCYSIPFTTWAANMDRDARANYNMTPNFQVMELAIWTTDGSNNCSGNNTAQTAVQYQTVLNEAWMAIIHGREGLIWYNDISPSGSYNGYSPTCDNPSSPPATECFPVNGSGAVPIVTFTSQISSIGPNTVLANPTSVTVSSNQTTNCVASPYTVGQRVDATIRQYNGYVWIFAARLTDPLCNPSEDSASGLSTTFTISGVSVSGNATVYGESRTVPISSNTITDTFNPWDVHLYEISQASNSVTVVFSGGVLKGGVAQ